MYQKEAKTLNMAESYPDHFSDIKPLTSEEIEPLCEKLVGGSDE